MASPMPQPGRREYPFAWPMPQRAEVLPVAGLQTRNTDIDLRRGELAWTPRTVQ